MRRFFNAEQADGAVLAAAHGGEAGNRWRRAARILSETELRIVRWFAGLTRVSAVAALTAAVNLLGNGWLYPPIAILLLLSGVPRSAIILAAATVATVTSHALYALIKRGIARPRPFERDSGLVPLARPLDRYSFPSGHCMTLVAVAVPFARALPQLWPLFAFALCALAFCRLAAAHHYPSDVVGGIVLGAAVALPVSAWLLPA